MGLAGQPQCAPTNSDTLLPTDMLWAFMPSGLLGGRPSLNLEWPLVNPYSA